MSNASSSRKHSSALRNSPQPTPEVLDILETSKQETCSFEPTKEAKEVPVSNDERTLRIGTTLGPEREEALMGFLRANLDVFA
jgi:hypothetical protein